VTSIRTYSGVAFFGMNGDLYHMLRSEGGRKAVKKINSNTLGSRINDLYYLPRAKTIYVATDKGMFQSYIRVLTDIREDGLTFSQVCQLNENGIIEYFENYSMVPLNEESIATLKDFVVGTERGILSH
jgi:hypothetical protein